LFVGFLDKATDKQSAGGRELDDAKASIGGDKVGSSSKTIVASLFFFALLTSDCSSFVGVWNE